MKRFILLGFCLFLSLGLWSPSHAEAQSIGKWMMHEGKGVIQFSSCMSSHGNVAEYNYASIPAWPAGWKSAPNPDKVGFSRPSILCGVANCRCGGDFTYFRNTVTLPQNFNLTKFEIELNGMDDGTRVTIFNSKHPNGVTPAGGYIFLGGKLTQDLKSYAQVGEANTIILTHVDDCCQQSNLQEAFIRINGARVNPCTPAAEVCDGKDNDCNGQIDDNLTKQCSNTCGSGTQRCVSGKWEACNPKGSRDCGVTKGICKSGKESCSDGKWSGVCVGEVKAETEICDGKDNDCDGKTDEDITPEPCKSICGSGTKTCQNGKMSECNVPQPETEVCDGKDNDCNGQIDDKLTRSCKTACGAGEETCKGGQWVECSAPKKHNEICDGKDNDCDGQIDSGKDLCPPRMQCTNGQCVQPCQGGECTGGLLCKDGHCVGKTCQEVTCQTGETCINGQCFDACYKVSCTALQTCKQGKCVDNSCYTNGCPNAGEICVNGVCQADPCKSVTCNAGEFCREGKCVSSCASVQCAGNEQCVDGKCEQDPQKNGPCEKVQCNDGQRCQNGQCVDEPCSTVTCPKGRTCLQGVCVHDPCEHTTCASGESCVLVNGKAQCVGDSQSGEKTQAQEPTPQTDAAPTEGPVSQADTGAENPSSGPEVVDGGTVGQAGNGDKGNTNNGRGGRAAGCTCSSTQAPVFGLWFLILLVFFRLRPRIYSE